MDVSFCSRGSITCYMDVCLSSRGSITCYMNVCLSSRGSIIIYRNVCLSSRSGTICHIPSSIMNISLSKWVVYPSMQNAWVYRHSVRICHQPWVPVGKEKRGSCSSFLGYRSSGRQAKNCEKYQFHAVFCRYHWLLPM